MMILLIVRRKGSLDGWTHRRMWKLLLFSWLNSLIYISIISLLSTSFQVKKRNLLIEWAKTIDFRNMLERWMLRSESIEFYLQYFPHWFHAAGRWASPSHLKMWDPIKRWPIFCTHHNPHIELNGFIVSEPPPRNWYSATTHAQHPDYTGSCQKMFWMHIQRVCINNSIL